jgi:hypothetical protein
MSFVGNVNRSEERRESRADTINAQFAKLRLRCGIAADMPELPPVLSERGSVVAQYSRVQKSFARVD